MTASAPARRRDSLPWTADQTRLIKQTLLKPKNRDASDDELLLFAYQCERTGLDPFTGQIHGIYRWNRRLQREELKVQVAIDGLRLIAERTGKYLGQTPVEWSGPDHDWVDLWTADEPPFAARVGVFKVGRDHATVATAKWRSYAQTNSNGQLTGLWRRMPEHMIGKCAEALALRKAFPNETSGLYIPEEMGHADAEDERARELPGAKLDEAKAEAPPERRQSRSRKAPELDAEIRRLCVELSGEKLGENKAAAFIRGATTLAAKRSVIERLSADLDRRNT